MLYRFFFCFLYDHFFVLLRRASDHVGVTIFSNAQCVHDISGPHEFIAPVFDGICGAESLVFCVAFS